MKNVFIIQIFEKRENPNHVDEPQYLVCPDFQRMLDAVVNLTKNRVKFSVFEIGKCIGDYS